VKIIRINEHVLQLKRAHFVNAYLVREDDGFTLVDTTLGRGADALLAAAKDAGGPITRIALTHGHQDHAGSLDALRERLGAQVEIAMSDLDARECSGERTAARMPAVMTGAAIVLTRPSSQMLPTSSAAMPTSSQDMTPRSRSHRGAAKMPASWAGSISTTTLSLSPFGSTASG